MSATHSSGGIVAAIGASMIMFGLLLIVRAGRFKTSAERTGHGRAAAFIKGELTLRKWVAIAGVPVLIVGLIMLAAGS